MSMDIPAEHHFLFDLQGFIVLKGVLDADTRQQLIETTQRLENTTFDDASWRDLVKSDKDPDPTLQVNGPVTRLNGLLRLDPAYDQLVDHPTVLPYLYAFAEAPQLGNTWTISKTNGAPAGSWHRGIRNHDYVKTSGGQIISRMLNTIYFLYDQGPEDGTLGVVPGSHKSDFNIATDKPGLELTGSVPVSVEAGDVLIFSEALMHCGLPKTTDAPRCNVHFNYIHRNFNVMTYSPQHNRHFCHGPATRARFNDEQRKLTEWMEHAQPIEHAPETANA